MITGMNESKTSIKHILCSFRCKFDDKKRNSNQKCSQEKCQCECKKPIKQGACKKDYVWNPSTYTCEADRFWKSIIGDLAITRDEIIDKIKAKGQQLK